MAYRHCWHLTKLKEALQEPGIAIAWNRSSTSQPCAENLKSELAAALMKSMSADPQMHDNLFATAGALLAPAITDRMVDSIVTPDGIALMLSQGKVSRRARSPASSLRPHRTLQILKPRCHTEPWIVSGSPFGAGTSPT